MVEGEVGCGINGDFLTVTRILGRSGILGRCGILGRRGVLGGILTFAVGDGVGRCGVGFGVVLGDGAADVLIESGQSTHSTCAQVAVEQRCACNHQYKEQDHDQQSFFLHRNTSLAQQRHEPTEKTRCHGKAEDDQQHAADDVDNGVVAFDEGEGTFQFVNEDGA